MARWDFAWILTLARKEMEDSRLNAIECLKTDYVRKRSTEIKALSTLIRFQTKTELFWIVFKKICVQTYRFHIVFARPHYNAVSVWKRCYTLSAHGQINSTHAHFNISAHEIGAKLKPYGSVCPPFGILTVEWSGARSCLFLMTPPFSDSIVFSVHTRKQRFQKASFSNRSALQNVFEWLRFRWSFSAL